MCRTAIDNMNPQQPPFEHVDGIERYRGVPVERRTIAVGGAVFKIAGLKDAADLLDEPDYAKRFLEEDLAPYGMELWPASVMLAGYILQDELGCGRPAIEIGCGLALVSMVAARRGWRTDATDCDPASLRFAEYNAACNGVGIASFEVLDWHDPPDGPRYDRVFAADVLYERKDHEAVVSCIDQLLAPDGLALIADPNRGVADRFASMAGERGFDVSFVSTTAIGVGEKPVAGRIFRLRRAANVNRATGGTM